MTAAGSSATDALHSIYDRATSAFGYGAGDSSQEKEKPAEGANEADAKEEGSGDGDGYIDGPGNHPGTQQKPRPNNTDHDHSEYKNDLPVEEDTDTNIDEASASVGKSEIKDDGGKGVDDGERRSRKTMSGNRADALERALGDEGPTGHFAGAKIGKQLESDMYAKKNAESNQADSHIIKKDTSAAAGAAIGEPLQSNRNDPKRAKQEAKAKDEDAAAAADEEEEDDAADRDSETDEETREKVKQAATEQHPHQKGPKWASRPDEGQRQKLKKMAEEKKARDKEAREAAGSKNPIKNWASLKLGSGKKAAQGEVDPNQEEDKTPDIGGIDLLRDPKDNDAKANADKDNADQDNAGTPDQSRPKSSNRLSSLFSGGATPSKDAKGKSLRQEEASSSPATEQAADQKDGQEAEGEESRPKPSSRNNSQTPGGGQNAKMNKMAKIMMGGGQSRRSSTAPAPESPSQDDSQNEKKTGLDGVQMPSGGSSSASARWGALRKRLKENTNKRAKGGEQKARVVGQMSVITELQTGILPVFMLKMSLERDEQGNRRIPVLLNHLRLRISDSVNVLNSTSAIFRIELEYGDALVRWVCYRSLRDFINLHTHYRAAAIKGYLGRPVGNNEGDLGLPSFPKTSLPYFNQLQRQNRTKNNANVKADFAKAQRGALEDYIIELIKRTMFRPEANRLCKFFEISALSISLATRGGFQGKQGYLRILSKSSRKDAQKGILTPISWIKSHEPKWFIVRESYIVIVDEPDSLQVHDVFLVDGAFEIERPKRLYKQTFHLAHELARDKGDDEKSKQKEEAEEREKKQEGKGPHDYNTDEGAEKGIGKSGHDKQVGKSAKQLTGDVQSKDQTAILTDGQFRDQEEEDEATGAKKKAKHGANANVSSHTFYIKNAERKLKLVAKNERQMDQFIASMERVARRNIFSKSNRFGSFAPIRLNCNAQWLVDGRDYFWQVSRALMRAKDRIFIHDWWLSPELYLRRPGTPKYRLDNILKKKAEEGVKIFVIVYNEVSNNFTPTDSNYTKQRLIGLHRNIYVQRSPSHFQTGTFYWAHHEKLCVIDETIAFMGGLDLCFGRWDTSAHLLTDNHANHVADGDDKPQHDGTLLGPGVKGKGILRLARTGLCQ